MSKKRTSKKFPAYLALTCALLFSLCENVNCQKSAIYTRGNWQTSLGPAESVSGKSYAYTASGSIKIGVRDKYGEQGHYTATFIITAPNRSVYKQLINVKGDDFAYVTFPGDFKLPSVRQGIYSLNIYVKNRLVVSFRFKYMP